MRTTKEIIKERKFIEEKLTQAEINFNKINYISKIKKIKIREKEKLIEKSSPEGILRIKGKLEKKIISREKTLSKIEYIKNKNYKDELLRNAHLYNQKNILLKINIDIKSISKSIKKHTNISTDNLKIDINKLNDEIYKILPKIIDKKTIVDKYRRRYKELSKEWNKIFPIEDNYNIISVKNLDIFYGNKQALFDVSIDFPKNKVTAIIGPSGCGKSTLLKTLNRINDEIPLFKARGKIIFQNEIDILTLKNIYDPTEKITLPELRTKIGMVFQQPNPFPMSIFNNVAYGPRINGIKNRSILKEIVDESLKKAAIYDQVKGNLNLLATGLSGGQQQRLCIARAIANRPDVLLMDEPTSSLDPIAASKIEDLILELKKDYTIIMVTHSMQQAARISDKTAFLYQGELIEYGETKQIFTKPKEKKTDDYIRGKFG